MISEEKEFLWWVQKWEDRREGEREYPGEVGERPAWRELKVG